MKAFLLLILTGAIAGCAHPELTRRHFAAWSDRAPTATASLSIFVTKTPPTTSPSFISGFSPRGQQALIDALAANLNSDQLLAVLTEGPKDPAEALQPKYRNEFKKRLVFSVDKKLTASEPQPGDRLDVMKVQVKLDDGVIFSSVSKVGDEYATVDLGKLTLAQTAKVAAGATFGPSTGSNPEGSNVSAEYGRTLTEEVSLRQRYVVLSPSISTDGRTLTIYREGVVGIDLAGTFFVDVVMRVTETSPRQVFVAVDPLFQNGAAVPPGFKFRFDDWYLPTRGGNADVTGSYRLRHVWLNDNSVVEGDDVAKYQLGQFDAALATLIPDDEARMTRVTHVIRAGEPADAPTLKYRKRDGTGSELRFASEEQANQLLNWITANRATNSQLDQYHPLMIGDQVGPFGESDLKALRVRVVAN